MSIGILVGAIAGYRGGRVDAFMMRINGHRACVPVLLIILAIVPIVGPSVINIMLVIGLLGWPIVARLVRCRVPITEEREYVVAARVLGVPGSRIVTRHLLPNTTGRPDRHRDPWCGRWQSSRRPDSASWDWACRPPEPSWGNMLSSALDLGTNPRQALAWLAPACLIANRGSVDQFHWRRPSEMA